MIITKTNAEWLDCIQDLNAVANCAGVTAFAVNHNFNTIYNTISDYVEMRNQIISMYGSLDENGQISISDPEMIGKAEAQLAPFDDLEVSLDIVMLPEDHLIKSNILLAQMRRIRWMIKSIPTELAKSIVGDIEEEEEVTPDAQPADEGEHYDPKEPVTDDRFV